MLQVPIFTKLQNLILPLIDQHNSGDGLHLVDKLLEVWKGKGVDGRGVQNNRLTEKTDTTEEKLTKKTEPK